MGRPPPASAPPRPQDREGAALAAGSAEPSGRAVGRALAAFVLVTLLVTGAGRIDNVDTQHVLATTTSLLDDGDFDVRDDLDTILAVNVARDARGRVFTHWNIGTTLVQAPFHVLGSAAAAVAQAAGLAVPVGYAREFFVSLLSPLFGALTTVAFYALGRTLGVGPRGAAVTALVGLFSTVLWPYAKSAYFEIVQAFFLTAGVCSLIRLAERRGSDRRNALAAGACLGALLLLKVAFTAVIPVLFVYPLLRRARELRSRRTVGTALAVAVPLAAAVAATLLFNALRFGDPLETGYRDPFTTDVLAGLAFQLVSPQQGLFLYSPLALVAALLAVRTPPRWRPLVGWLYAVALLHLAVYVSHHLWRVNGWGPRYLVPVVPLLLVPLFFASDAWGRIGRALRTAVVTAAIAGFALQLLPFLNPFDQYFVLEADLRTVADPPPPEGRAVPLAVLPELLAPKLRGDPAVYDAATFGGPAGVRLDHTVYPGLRSLNFWFVYAAEALRSPLPYAAAVGGMLLAACAAAVLLRRLRGASRA